MVMHVWAVKPNRFDDPIICFSSLQGALRFVKSLNIPEMHRNDCIVEMPVFESFMEVEDDKVL